jgi:FxsC-like protein
MPAFRFFISHARTGTPGDNLQHLFYDDLDKEIKQIMHASEAGFFDVEGIPAGAEWPRTLEAALNSTHCLVCLYSSAYFNSKPCGQEVKAFQLRLQKYVEQNPGLKPELLIPVFWESKSDVETLIPNALGSVHYNLPPIPGASTSRQDDVQAMLNQTGLRAIMTQSAVGSTPHASAYLDIIRAYAEQIKRASTRFDISGCGFTGSFASLDNAFLTQQISPGPANSSTRSYGKGPKFVRFLFVVGKPDELAALAERRATSCYADDSLLWKPFLPPTDDDVASICQSAVTQEGLLALWVDTSVVLDEDAVKKTVKQAQSSNNVLVVVIDPWSALLPNWSALMKVLDEIRIKYGSILIPWNELDTDVAQHKDKLQEALEAVFEATAAEHSSWFSEISLRDRKSMEDQLRARIAVIRSRIVSHLAKEGRVKPLPPGSQLPNNPVPA